MQSPAHPFEYRRGLLLKLNVPLNYHSVINRCKVIEPDIAQIACDDAQDFPTQTRLQIVQVRLQHATAATQILRLEFLLRAVVHLRTARLVNAAVSDVVVRVTAAVLEAPRAKGTRAALAPQREAAFEVNKDGVAARAL